MVLGVLGVEGSGPEWQCREWRAVQVGEVPNLGIPSLLPRKLPFTPQVSGSVASTTSPLNLRTLWRESEGHGVLYTDLSHH